MATIATLSVNLIARVTNFAKGLTKAKKHLHWTEKGALALRTQVLQLGAAYAGFHTVVESVRAFAEFEKQMAAVNTMLSGDSTPLLREYTKHVEELAATYGQTTETMAKGLYDILSASIDTAKAIEVLEVATQAAVGGMTDTATSAKTIVSILNAYSMEAEQAEKVADQLFATIKRGVLVYDDLSASLGKVLSMAAVAEVPLHEVLGTLATMTRAGLDAEQATTALSMTIKGFVDPTKESAQAAEALDIELNAAALRSKGLLGAIEPLRHVQSEMVPVLVGNIRAYRGLAAVLANYEAAVRDVEGVQTSLGDKQEAYNKMADTTSMKLAQLSEDWQAIKRDIGGTIAPLISATTALKDYGDQITELQAELDKAAYGFTLAEQALYQEKGILIPTAEAVEALKKLSKMAKEIEKAEMVPIDEEALKQAEAAAEALLKRMKEVDAIEKRAWENLRNYGKTQAEIGLEMAKRAQLEGLISQKMYDRILYATRETQELEKQTEAIKKRQQLEEQMARAMDAKVESIKDWLKSAEEQLADFRETLLKLWETGRLTLAEVTAGIAKRTEELAPKQTAIPGLAAFESRFRQTAPGGPTKSEQYLDQVVKNTKAIEKAVKGRIGGREGFPVVGLN